VPARLGLVSVGADGQLFIGAIFGTAVVLAFPAAPALVLLPAMLLAGMVGGALWGFVPGLLRGRLDANETIITLLLNYVAALLVNALVFGPWKDPSNLGWPATVTFPAAATLPGLFGTRTHLGLAFGIAAAIGFGVLFTRSRWGRELSILRGNAKVGRMIGLSFAREAMIVMSLGGALGGLAGICEVAAIQGRLQPGISVGYGLTGFLVAWLSGHNPFIAIVVSTLIGGLIAAGDSLQLYAKVPAASATILQGLLFATALAVGSLSQRWRASRG
jgi:general nucleoside transport system permease protein